MTDEAVVLENAARTASTTSPQVLNYKGKGVILVLDVTAVGGTPGTITTVALQVKSQDGNWVTIYSFGSLTLNSVGTRAFCIDPGAASAASFTAAPLQGPVPRRFQIVVTHLDGNSITYSMKAYFLP